VLNIYVLYFINNISFYLTFLLHVRDVHIDTVFFVIYYNSCDGMFLLCFCCGEGIGRLFALYTRYIQTDLLILEDREIRVATKTVKIPLRLRQMTILSAVRIQKPQRINGKKTELLKVWKNWTVIMNA